MFFSTQNDVIIYIEEKVSSLAARLLEVAVPEKEVPFEQFIKPRRDLSGAEENKPVVAIGNMNERKDFEPVYDTGAEADISDAVLLILRNLYVPKSGGKEAARAKKRASGDCGKKREQGRLYQGRFRKVQHPL